VFDDGQLLDLLLLAGWYHAISFVATGARVAVEPAAPRFSDYAGGAATGAMGGDVTPGGGRER
jgi:hypothetical protein